MIKLKWKSTHANKKVNNKREKPGACILCFSRIYAISLQRYLAEEKSTPMNSNLLLLVFIFTFFYSYWCCQMNRQMAFKSGTSRLLLHRTSGFLIGLFFFLLLFRSLRVFSFIFFCAFFFYLFIFLNSATWCSYTRAMRYLTVKNEHRIHGRTLRTKLIY